MLLISCKNTPSKLLLNNSLIKVDSVSPTQQFLIDKQNDSIYKVGDYLFEGNKNLVFDFFRNGHPPDKLKSNGDTLYSDSLYTILANNKKVSSVVYKKYITAYKFPDYKIDKIYEGNLAKPDFSTAPLAKKYQTAIRKSCTDSTVNFAGHYTIAEWGCGMECLMMAVIDRTNGRIFYSEKHLPFDTIDGHWGIKYQKDSKLIIVNSYLLEDYPGYSMQQSWRKLSYYQWNNNDFVKLK